MAAKKKPAVPMQRTIDGTEEPVTQSVPDRPFDIQVLRIEDIYPDENQPRGSMTGIDELAASMRTFGQMTPILVRQTGNTYRLIGGERRWSAAKANGAETIYARVAVSDDAEVSLLELADNQHVALTDEERSRGAQRAFTFDAPIERVAAATGRSADSIERARRGYVAVGDPTVAEELTLDDLMAVDELSDDADAVSRYLASSALNRSYTLRTLRRERANVVKVAELTAIIKTAKLKLLTGIDYSKWRVVARATIQPHQGETAACIETYGTPSIAWLTPAKSGEDPEQAARREAADKHLQAATAAHEARLAHIASHATAPQLLSLAEAAWEGTGTFEARAHDADVQELEDGPLADVSGFYARVVAAVLASVEAYTYQVFRYSSIPQWAGTDTATAALAYLDGLVAVGYMPSEAEAEQVQALRDAVAALDAEKEDGDE